jgi:membrane-associated phospholipid phosphatase
MNFLLELIDTIGNIGPQILIITSIFLLCNKTTTLLIYLFGLFVNISLNIFLKLLFRHPRPTENIRLFNLKLINNKYIEFNKYGMPSGHTQNVFFNTFFIYYSLKNTKLIIFYLFISFLTLYQRIHWNYHYIDQTIWGSIIGSFIGYLFSLINKNVIKKRQKMKEKEDDNGPL